MKIPILSGIYTDERANFRTALPVNMVPVPRSTGLSDGYLRPADGLVEFGGGPGVDRGGINWNGVCYRVMGTSLVRIAEDGATFILGNVGGHGQVSLTYSFDLLAVASAGNLFYWDGASVSQVTDPDLGTSLDVEWIDGYFMSTDGEFLVVTELNNPFSVDQFKYVSAEIDPDPILAVTKIRNEAHAIGRYTIEVFQNVGGTGFPFARINGAQIQKGCVGTHAQCVFLESLAFLGSGRGEAPSIYLGANAAAIRISTREIDQILVEYSEDVLAVVVLEAKVDRGHQNLLIHLPDRTLVYDAAASSVAKQPAWHVLHSSLTVGKYRGKNLVWCYDKWLVGDTASWKHGFLSLDTSEHYGQIIGWEFSTAILYGQGRGMIIHSLELVGLPGRVALGKNPFVSTAYSIDGEVWSIAAPVRLGTIGYRTKRIVWFRQGLVRNWRIQRFTGTSDARFSVARLEATVEGLNA